NPKYEELAKAYFEQLQTLPTVTGVLAGAGGTEVWAGEKKDVLISGADAVLMIRYAPKKKKGPYAGLRISPHTSGPRVLLATICAYTQKALSDQAADQQAHDDLKDLVDAAVNGTEDKRHRLLKANSEYTIEVAYTVAAWQPTDDAEKN